MRRNYKLSSMLHKIFLFYYDGFRSMTTIGKKLWILIVVKLFLFFVIMKLVFFPNLLHRDFKTDKERAQHVRQELLKPH